MAYYLSYYYSNSCKLASFFGYSGSLEGGASTSLTSCLIGSYLTTTSGCLTGYGLANGSIFISGSFGWGLASGSYLIYYGYYLGATGLRSSSSESLNSPFFYY